LCVSIRCSRESLTSGHISVPGWHRMDNLWRFTRQCSQDTPRINPRRTNLRMWLRAFATLATVHAIASFWLGPAMRGEDRGAEGFLSYVRLEQGIPADHPLRTAERRRCRRTHAWKRAATWGGWACYVNKSMRSNMNGCASSRRFPQWSKALARGIGVGVETADIWSTSFLCAACATAESSPVMRGSLRRNAGAKRASRGPAMLAYATS
jgi:hypothetical protein